LKIADATMKEIENAATRATTLQDRKTGLREGIELHQGRVRSGRGTAEANACEHYAAGLARMLSIRVKE
jgi:hypothetical protein